MQELVREYLSNVKSRRKRRRRITITIAVFAVLVVGSVVWSLARMGIAMTGDPKCGVEEHTHSDVCYTDTLVCGMEESAGHTHSDACYQTESTLVCGMEESEEHVHDESCYAASQTLICGQEESTGHTHTDACHDKALSCGKAEHTHTEDCFIDSGADVEDASVWDAQYAGVEWKDAWGEDLAAAAQMQVGYKESTKNYIVAEDGSHKGYTRYGQFVGDAYADWDAPFVNFCLHYAGLEASNMFPNEKVTAQWYDTFVKANEENQKYLTAPAGYEPKPGDIIFFHKEGEETDTQMGIVSSYDKEKNEIKVIEGNSGNEVKENKYDIGDQYISSYMMVTEMEKAYKPSDAGEGSAGENTEAPEDTSQIFTTEENAEEIWAYENSYEDDTIVIHVRAGEGVVPEGAELSVTPIEQKEVTSDMTEEEAAEAEKVNEQYELTNQKLQEESEKKQETLEGFLAYDICFIVDGEEVEPSGDVKVTMDFKEATKPEGVSENAVVAVNHLKEDENAADGIVVEDLTAKDETTIVTSEENAPVEKIELVAESFSTFVIRWYKYTYDDKGNEIINLETLGNIEIEYYDLNDQKLEIEKEQKIEFQSDYSQVRLLEVFDGNIVYSGKTYSYKDVKLSINQSEYVSVETIQYNSGEDALIFLDSEGRSYKYDVKNDSARIKVICAPSSELNVDLGFATVKLSKEIERVDENGKAINISADETISLSQGVPRALEDVLNQRITDSNGKKYQYKKAWVDLTTFGPGFQEIKSIAYMEGGVIAFYDGNDNTILTCGLSEGAVRLKIEYGPLIGLAISDDQITEDGNLTLDVGGNIDSIIGEAQKEGKRVEYIWEKSINGGDYEEVQSVRYEDMTTISADGKSLNVPLDNGGLSRTRSSVKYRAKLVAIDESGSSQTLAEAKPYSVPYYSEVQNGSFESPVVKELTKQQIGMEDVPGWKTTDLLGSQGDGASCIEIVRANEAGGVATEYGEAVIFADEGKQFAEINAEGNGALYQDVITLKGRPLDYYFSHRGRINSNTNGFDQMYVVIIPTGLAMKGLHGDNNPIDTNGEVGELLQLSEEERNSKGIYVQPYVASPRIWQRNHDVYIPTSSMTRFFFVSNQPALPSYGNFIDNVTFSQNMPTPTVDKFNLRVEKTVKGLNAEELEKLKDSLTFSVEVKDSQNKNYIGNKDSKDGLLVGDKVTVGAKDMIWYADKEDSFTGYYNYIDNPINGTYTITVTENAGTTSVEGYTLSSTTSKTTVTTPTDTGNQEDIKDGSNTTVVSKQRVRINFTNTYVKENVKPAATKKINFTKIWKDFDDKYDTRPDKLEVELVGQIPDKENEDGLHELTTVELESLLKDLLDGEPPKTLDQILHKEVTPDEKGNWKCTWESIPVYFDKAGTIEIKWSVKETLTGNQYKPETSGELETESKLLEKNKPEAEKDDEYSITNVLDDEAMKNWRMVKHSTSDKNKTLQGAEFAMSSASLPSEIVATGISKEDGEIEWKPVNGTVAEWSNFKKTLDGRYIISETKAPEGYSRNERGWEVEFVNGILDIKTQTDISKETEDGIVFYIGNTAVYALPDSGGSGIYLYMFSGILLMAVAVLITYKNKKRRKGVLRS